MFLIKSMNVIQRKLKISQVLNMLYITLIETSSKSSEMALLVMINSWPEFKRSSMETNMWFLMI